VVLPRRVIQNNSERADEPPFLPPPPGQPKVGSGDGEIIRSTIWEKYGGMRAAKPPVPGPLGPKIPCHDGVRGFRMVLGPGGASPWAR